MDYIMNGVNYQTLIMMLSDAPRIITAKEAKAQQSAEEEAAGIVGFFQSRLNK